MPGTYAAVQTHFELVSAGRLRREDGPCVAQVRPLMAAAQQIVACRVRLKHDLSGESMNERLRA